MTDNRTTELLRKLLEESDVKWWEGEDERKTLWESNGLTWEYFNDENGDAWLGFLGACEQDITPEQAIAATLGRPRAKSHPYGYERDTGCYDCTRCECGCINDISARYCNDCGGEIEIDESSEKEIYRIPRHLVFAEKHDDGSLELCERRYVPEDAATMGNDRERRLELLAKQLWYLVNHRSGYGYAAALEAIEELGVEVDE